METGIARVCPTPPWHVAFRDEGTRMILNMLRKAGGPMMTRDIVLAVTTARGLNATDEPMRISSSLPEMREREVSPVARRGAPRYREQLRKRIDKMPMLVDVRRRAA